MKILFIGSKEKNGYSYYQFKILKKIYKSVDILELKNLNFIIKYLNILSWKYNFKFFDYIIYNSLQSSVKKNYNFIYIHNENLIGEKSIKYLKKKCKKIFYYCPDNPFVNRDNQRWKLLKKNFHLFDLIIFMQKNRFKYAKKIGLTKISWIPPTFKIEEQKRLKIDFNTKKKYASDVILIATCFPERERLVLKLIENGVNIKIYGDKWQNSYVHKRYKKYFGPKISDDKLYVKLIQSAKIAVCLPSYENDDDITNRSLEIPYIGTLLLAKKTKTHEEFFKNNKDAVFFTSFNDCLNKINFFLKNNNLRKVIAKNGRKVILKNIKLLSFEENIKRIISKKLI
jgi:spore maturation protein CgeB